MSPRSAGASVPAAAMFDMDGVLIQSREVIARAWRSVAREYEIEITDDDVHEHVHGRPGSYTLDKLFGALPVEQRRVVKQRVDAAEETADSDLTAGVAELLRELAAAHVPVALVTSSWPARIHHVLSQHALRGYFEVIIHRHDVVQGKPDPGCYLLAASRLGVAPGAALVFEDSQSGVVAAVRSGAPCIGIGDDPSLTASGAFLVKPDFLGVRLSDLAGYLQAYRR